MAIRPGPPIAQLGLDSDVTKPVALNRDQAWIVSAFLRAGAASLEQMPLRSTDACGAIHRAEQCEFARRVADDLDGWRGA